jgi:hypothetical protein
MNSRITRQQSNARAQEVVAGSGAQEAPAAPASSAAAEQDDPVSATTATSSSIPPGSAAEETGSTFLLPSPEELLRTIDSTPDQDGQPGSSSAMSTTIGTHSVNASHSWTSLPIMRTANINQQPLAEHSAAAVKKWAEILRNTAQNGIQWRTPRHKFSDEGWRQVRRALINGKLLKDINDVSWHEWDDELLIKNVTLVLPEQGRAYSLMEGGQDVAEGLTRLAGTLSGAHGKEITSAAPARAFIARLEKHCFDALPATMLERPPADLTLEESTTVIKLNRAMLGAVEKHMLGGARIKSELREKVTKTSFAQLLENIEQANQQVIQSWAQLEGILPAHIRAAITNKPAGNQPQYKQQQPPYKQQQQQHKQQQKSPLYKPNHKPANAATTGSTARDPNTICTVCGRAGHSRTQCRLSNHPDANKESTAWADSTKGKAWAATGKATLPFTETLSGARYTPPTVPKTSTNHNYTNNGHKRQRTTSKYTTICLECTTTTTGSGRVITRHTPSVMVPARDHTPPNTITTPTPGALPCSIIALSHEQDTVLEEATALLDSGSLGKRGNYMSSTLADKLEQVHHVEMVQCTATLCGCCTAMQQPVHRQCSVAVQLFDEITKTNQIVLADFVVVPQLRYDIIIGNNTITEQMALQKIIMQNWLINANRTMHNQLRDAEAQPNDVMKLGNEPNRTGGTDSMTELVACYEALKAKVEQNFWEDNTPEGIRRRQVTHRLLRHEAQQLIIAATDDSEGTLPTQLHGTDAFQQEIKTICRQHAPCFSRELNANPANIEPMTVRVDPHWETKANRQPCRLQSFHKDEEIRKQVKTMLEAGVIRVSEQATAYSQVLLTPKPNGAWRFCVDYRRLNACTIPSTEWPIPHIQRMIDRIGHRKPKHFGVLDLTKGYYQAPLAEASRRYTAFQTNDGVYEWNRVPMGLAGAPSYFQREMTTKVLRGLIGSVCEVYLDDIIVYGTTQEEFLSNLAQVLKALERRGVTVNPDKCRLGLQEIEYVGHVINKDGKSFTRTKLMKVIQVPQPATMKEMRSFLGLANYFRDHIRDHSTIVQPLHELLTDYRKSAKLKWNEPALAAFAAIKEAINNCPQLFFPDRTSKVHLYTDASDVGIGAYVTQEVEGKEQPIAIMSKTFNKQQKRWSVPEKECYAIHEAVHKFAYLLRDVHFMLHTDHQNLTYIRDSGSAKVIRWKLDIQTYRFTLVHIPGPDNVVADFFSRNHAAEEDDFQVEDENNVVQYLASLSIDTSEEPEEEEVMICNAVWHDRHIPNDKYNVIKANHNATMGHHGVDSTIRKILKNTPKWKYMRSHVQQFIAQCDTCQKQTDRPIQNNPYRYSIQRYYPFERICIDVIGPYPEDTEGNQYALVVVDCFSRYVATYPLKENSALRVAQSLLAHATHFGIPCEIQSDRGSSFVNKIIKEFLELEGSEHILSVQYSHPENTIVERCNKEVVRGIRNYLYDNKLATKQWTNAIPYTIRIHNNTMIETINCSPADIIFGRRINQSPNILITPEERDDNHETLEEWNLRQQTLQDMASAYARQRLTQHRDQQEARNVEPITTFPVNSYVLVANDTSSSMSGKRKHKLLPTFTGPFQVLDVKDSAYTLLNLVNKRTIVRPMHLLKQFEFDATRTNPFEIALKDYADDYEVEQIIDHRGQWKRHSRMEFTRTRHICTVEKLVTQ